MSGAKHTPGPWVIAEAVGNKHSSNQMRRVRCANEGVDHGAVCEVYGISDGSIAAANASLIAAAPDLLQALIDREAEATGQPKSCSHEHSCVCVGIASRAAIAKAQS